MEKYICPMCEHTIFSNRISRQVGGVVLECAVCGHFALWPQPNDDEIISWYKETYPIDHSKNGIALFDNHTVNSLRKHDPRKGISVIDIGCGRGNLLKYCARKGYKVTGIEICKEFLSNLYDGEFVVYNRSLEEMSCSNDKYDWVICKDILEHINDPIKAIEILSGLVSVGGYLLIESPNGNAIREYEQDAFALFTNREHLHYFIPDQLIRLLQSYGFVFVCKKFYPASAGFGRSYFSRKRHEKVCDDLCKIAPGQCNFAQRNSFSYIRHIMGKAPCAFRALVRSLAQIARIIASLDQIVKGTAYEFLIIMKKS